MEGKLVFVSSYFIGTAVFINLYFKKNCNFRLYTILSHVFTYKPFLKSSEDTNSIQYTVYIQYTQCVLNSKKMSKLNYVLKNVPDGICLM